MTNVYLVVDAGGTYLKSALLKEDGSICEASSFSIPSCSEGTEEEVGDAFRQILTRDIAWCKKYQFQMKGLGISIPGPFDYHQGIALMTHKYQCLYGKNVKELILKSGCLDSSLPIWFVHDVNAVLAGEMWKGIAKHYHNVAVVTLGTGLGFAYSKDGVIQCSALGSPLRSIFRTPCRDGILEDFTAQRGFIRLFEGRLGYSVDHLTVQDIGRMADEGNRIAITTFQEVAQILSEALSGILKEENISCLLFGGQISRSFAHMKENLKNLSLKVPTLKLISPVTSIDNAAFWGTLSMKPKDW